MSGGVQTWLILTEEREKRLRRRRMMEAANAALQSTLRGASDLPLSLDLRFDLAYARATGRIKSSRSLTACGH